MKRLHLAIATRDLAKTVDDYSVRLGSEPCVVIDGEYALWRTPQLNVSVRSDPLCKPGELRHPGWEDPDASDFSEKTDVNGIVWERFSAQRQAKEIEEIWPGSGYEVEG
ncbi:MAG: hypothetical protein WBN23_10095 [Woeseia sp.]